MTAAEIAKLEALLEKADSYAAAACDPGCQGRCRVCPYAELQKILNALPELLKAARDGERLLNLRCPGNNGGDDPVECQSYEAHEQGAPCPPGCCVMADEKDVRSIIAAMKESSRG